MSTPCEKHALLPVVGQSPCSGCEIERLQAENNRLSALLECSQGDCGQAVQMIDGLKAQVDTLSEWYANSMIEREALRRDAERYRWTSIEGNWVARMFGKWRAHVGAYGDANPTDWYPSREEAIDAAMSKDPLADKGR